MYQLTTTDAVIRLDDNTLIPADESHEAWRAYQAWLAEGGVPEPVPAAPALSPLEQIEALERQHQLPRLQREFMLTYMETEAKARAASLGFTEAQALAALMQNIGYRKAKELDNQIRDLRTQAAG